MSLTLFFHIAPEASENTLSDKLTEDIMYLKAHQVYKYSRQWVMRHIHLLTHGFNICSGIVYFEQHFSQVVMVKKI